MGSDAFARRGRRLGDLRVVVRRPAKLPRTLGAPSLFAACYGNVGSSIYYALGVTAAFALGLTPLALILAGFIFVTTALNYAEGTAALPHAGGSSSFARRAFNAPIGYIVGWVQLLNYTATVSISAYFAISYLGFLGKYVGLLDPLKSDATTHVVATMALITFLIVVNVIGIQESSILNLVLAFTDLITQLVLVILGIIILLDIQRVIQSIHWGIAPTWGNFLAGISIAMVTYTGIETISNLSEEAKDPGRNVPLATWWVIVAVLFVSAFLPTIGVSVFPVSYDPHTHAYTTQLATTWKADPVAGIVTGFPQEALRYWAQIWVGILAFTILVIATNAGLIGISRLSYSMAGADLLPHRLARLHPKFKTPYVSIIVFGLVAALLVLPGIIPGGKEIEFMSAVYSLAATFAFCSAHLSVMRLRFIEPALHRPYRMPWNIKFGRDSIPILSLVGALFIGTVFTQLIFQNISSSTFIFMGWLALGVLTYLLYRRYRHQPLWEPLEVPPAREREVDRVPFESQPRSARYRMGRRERITAHAARARHVHERHRPAWQLELELFFARHGAIRGVLIVLVFAAVSGFAVFIDLSAFDPFGPGLGWSPGLVIVAFLAAYVLNRSHSEE
ncbi:MAG: amino acid permease [Chloroflexi bacterium]|nr:MAG: amino acid permease [Chloroflexota bacterium]TMF73090.1 MAG: amino acid permease [Chloroflexota bacterium]TMF79061.1 MAG: amino acid permease [Chloroflexota bacterium]TMG43346.1 MAG: amino acid permease [Chloroflexota bacterium]